MIDRVSDAGFDDLTDLISSLTTRQLETLARVVGVTRRAAGSSFDNDDYWLGYRILGHVLSTVAERMRVGY